MPEEETKSVEAVEASQAITQATESENVQEEREQQTTNKQRDDQAYNWAEARRKMQELDRQNQDLADQVRKLTPKAPEPEEDYGIADDALVEGKFIKDLKKEIKQLKSYIQQKEVSTVDERLSHKFSDYADVVSKDNIELLKQTEPELALSLYKLQDDPYAQGVAAYKLLKKLDMGTQKDLAIEKERATKNSQKPLSVNAVTKQSALGNAHMFENGLTKELKSQLWKEMQDAKKRV